MPKAVITGGTGFIGSALSRSLSEDGWDVVCFTRNVEGAKKRLDSRIRPVSWDGRNGGEWEKELENAEAVINLAGSSIGKHKWTDSVRERIVSSRLHAGKAVAAAVRKATNGPKAVIQASAIGYYAHRADHTLTEDSPGGEGFLSSVCREWEDSSRMGEDSGVRRVVIRTGLVLGDGGLLDRMVTPMRFFIGGPLGSGRQWMSWIHLQDEVAAIRFLMDSNLEGVFNLVSPQPVRNKDFCRALGKAMRRPCWFPVPAPLLKLLFGRMAEETILSSQRVLPQRLLAEGFRFRFSQVDEALGNIFSGK